MLQPVQRRFNSSSNPLSFIATPIKTEKAEKERGHLGDTQMLLNYSQHICYLLGLDGISCELQSFEVCPNYLTKQVNSPVVTSEADSRRIRETGSTYLSVDHHHHP
jgi:hypothetical protein